MSEGLRRFVVLLGVFVIAFLAVFVFRRLQGGEGLWDLFRFGKKDQPEKFIPEDYTLGTEPALEPDDVKWLTRLDAEYAKLTEAVVPSVVSLYTEGMSTQSLLDLWGRRWQRSYPVSGIGSGVIVSEEGHVVTNQHVTDGKSKIRVTLHDGKSYDAILIGEDQDLDIAVIRIQAKDRQFKPLKFGDSDRVRPGQHAFAIGNPFGLGETITKGIISARERALSDKQRDLFQTDAAINPGNSGGPLVNIFGEIIAINVAIYSSDAVNPSFVGVGFSIPANDVREVFEQILQRGRPMRAWLGIQSYDWEPWSRSKTGYTGERGAFIYDVVTGSPAEKADLQPFDVILSYDGKEVQSRLHLFSLIQRTKVGKEVPIEVWREGGRMDLLATVIDSEEANKVGREELSSRSATDERIAREIGLVVRPLTVLQRAQVGSGVVVVEVVKGSQAELRGLLPGDVVLSVNNFETNTPQDFYARLFASAAVQDTTVLVQRARRRVAVKFDTVERISE